MPACRLHFCRNLTARQRFAQNRREMEALWYHQIADGPQSFNQPAPGTGFPCMQLRVRNRHWKQFPRNAAEIQEMDSLFSASPNFFSHGIGVLPGKAHGTVNRSDPWPETLSHRLTGWSTSSSHLCGYSTSSPSVDMKADQP